MPWPPNIVTYCFRRLRPAVEFYDRFTTRQLVSTCVFIITEFFDARKLCEELPQHHFARTIRKGIGTLHLEGGSVRRSCPRGTGTGARRQLREGNSSSAGQTGRAGILIVGTEPLSLVTACPPLLCFALTIADPTCLRTSGH
jgi:hypothetical protein